MKNKACAILGLIACAVTIVDIAHSASQGRYRALTVDNSVRDVRSGNNSIPGDGLDDYTAFATAVAGGGHILVPSGRWDLALSGVTPWLNLQSNTLIECEPGAVLSATGDNNAYRELFRINGKDNVAITGCTLIGNRTAARVSANALDFGVYVIGNSTRIRVEDVVIKDFAMDGLYAATATAGFPVYGHFNRITIDNCGRNGVAVANGSYLWFDELNVTNTNGQSPEAAFETETDADSEVHHVWVTRSKFDGNKRYTVRLGNGNGSTHDIFFEGSNVVTGGESAYASLIVYDNPGTNARVHVNNNTFDNCTNWCTTWYGTKDSSFNFNHIIKSLVDSAVVLQQTSATPNMGPRGMSVVGNAIDNAAWHGIEAKNMAGGRIAGNIIKSAQKDGLYMQYNQNVAVENNDIFAASQAAHNTNSGIVNYDGWGVSIRNNMVRNSEIWSRGTAQAGAADNITLAATDSAQNDLFNGLEIYLVSGTGSGQTKNISDYDGTTKVATVSASFSPSPDNTSVYWIRGAKRMKYAIINTESGSHIGGYNRIENNDTHEGGTDGEVADSGTTQVGNMVIGRTLIGSETWDPGSIADNATTTDNVTVLGAALGDLVIAVSHDNVTVGNVQLSGVVVAVDTVTVTLRNQTGGAYDCGSGTLRVAVRKVN